ncbi:MAG: UDP-N-acetylmuramoyl-L-alanyl-D-glutamate--2,6-diaminopimelate ligase [Polyangiales bacterium]
MTAEHQPGLRGATLGDLAKELHDARVIGDPETRVRDVRHDSREVTTGDLFVARPGTKTDGARFTLDAIARGAVAVASPTELAVPVPQIVVPDIEGALAFMSSYVWTHPTWVLDVIGITGTNGKTTTAWLVEHALRKLGARPGLLGTVAHRYGSLTWPALHTTPEADDIARRFAAMRDAGATHAVMEVSSHAIALKRVGAVRFRVAALTNITQDHLDFHGTMERYIAAKRALFEELGPGASVVNVDDATGADLARTVPGAISYSARGADATLSVRSGGARHGGIEAEVQTPDGVLTMRSPLAGAHNVENLLAALGILGAMDFPYARALDALSDAKGAPGRLERVTPTVGSARFDVLVDYAHTPDALERVIASVRATTPARVICLFGCGGDRDRAKRPLMGAAAARGADVVIVTSDNPRSEDPAEIARAAAEGVRGEGMSEAKGAHPAQGEFVVALDRREAIGLAVSIARDGDTVLIAGKGHETTQEVMGVRAPFDDRDEARAALDRIRAD